MSSNKVSQALKDLETASKKSFAAEQTLLGFSEYLAILLERPEQQTRGSAKYAQDMMDHFGKIPDPTSPGEFRFHLFDEKVGEHDRRVVNLVGVQNQIYRALKTFHRQGLNNKLLLLHGPNGSAKTSMLHAIMGGLERYSKERDGATYTFNWIFPVEKINKGSR